MCVCVHVCVVMVVVVCVCGWVGEGWVGGGGRQGRGARRHGCSRLGGAEQPEWRGRRHDPRYVAGVCPIAGPLRAHPGPPPHPPLCRGWLQCGAS